MRECDRLVKQAFLRVCLDKEANPLLAAGARLLARPLFVLGGRALAKPALRAAAKQTVSTIGNRAAAGGVSAGIGEAGVLRSAASRLSSMSRIKGQPTTFKGRLVDQFKPKNLLPTIGFTAAFSGGGPADEIMRGVPRGPVSPGAYPS